MLTIQLYLNQIMAHVDPIPFSFVRLTCFPDRFVYGLVDSISKGLSELNLWSRKDAECVKSVT